MPKGKPKTYSFSTNCKHVDRKSKARGMCQTCYSALMRKEKILSMSSIQKKMYFRNRCLKHDYGISLEDYNIMFNDQGGKCYLCGIHALELDRAFDVDHDHETGKVRKLLCSYCNKLLGQIETNPEFLIKAQKYIEEYK